MSVELNDEEVRKEINEGVNEYQEEKDQVSWDIPFNANDVASVEPGEIFVREGWKITPEGSIVTMVELIKTVKNEVVIVDTLSYEQLRDIIREAKEQKIEDAEEVKEDSQTLTETVFDDEIEEVESFAPEKEPQEEDEEFDDELVDVLDEEEELEEVPVIDNTEIPVEPVVPNETETPVDTPEVEEEEESEEPVEDVPVDTKPEEPTDNNLPAEPTTPEEPVIDTPVEEEHTDEPIVDTKPEEDTPDLPTDEETVEDTPAEDEKEPTVEEPNTDTTEETPTVPNTDIPNQPEVPVEEEKPIIDEKPIEPETPNTDTTPVEEEEKEPVKEDTTETTTNNEPPVRDSEYIKDTNYADPAKGCFYDMKEDKVINFSEEFKNAPSNEIRTHWDKNLTTMIKIIKELNTGIVSTISIKYNFTHVTLFVNTNDTELFANGAEVPVHTLLLSLHGEVMLVEDGIGRITGVINPDIVNYDNRFRDAINCKWSHEYDTYTTLKNLTYRELDVNDIVNEKYYIVSKENRQMQSLFYEPIQKTIESFTPVASDNQHIASVYLTKDEYDNLEGRVTTIEHLDPFTNKVEEFKYAIKKSITLIDAVDARSTQLVFQRLELIDDTYYVAAEYRSKIFIEAVKDITIY